MRDPNRIKPLLVLLEELWLSCPDQRLGQLICNLTKPGHDPFFQEDDITESTIRDRIIYGWGGKSGLDKE